MKAPHGLKAINAFYGNPKSADNTLNRQWYADNIVRCPLPAEWDMCLSWDKSQRVRSMLIHRRCLDTLTRCLNSVWNTARVLAKERFKDQHPEKTMSGAPLSAWWDTKTNVILKEHGLDQFGGSFNYRPIRGRSNLSTHAYGCSLDLSPATNGLGVKGSMPPWVVKIFKEEGWTWGGDFKSRPDYMHFQYCSGY